MGGYSAASEQLLSYDRHSVVQPSAQSLAKCHCARQLTGSRQCAQVPCTVRRHRQCTLIVWTCLCWMLVCTACTTLPPSVNPPSSLPTLIPTATAERLPTIDGTWHKLADGIELRLLEAPGLPVQVIRVDPDRVRFVVGYEPTTPRTLSVWVAQYGAVAAINGGFFDSRGEPVALLISNQQVVGESYVNQGGMFAIDDNGTPYLWSLAERPYDGTPFAQAMQGWPLLVRSDGSAAYTSDDNQRARRSAIALDRSGHVLLIAAPAASFSLSEWSQFLAATDLEIAIAMNLDGGSSTGLIAQSQYGSVRIDSFVPLPFALLVLPL